MKNPLKKAMSGSFFFRHPSSLMFIRTLYYWPIDTFEQLFGLRDPLTPPRGKVFIGGGNYRKLGEVFLQYFIELGHLQKNAAVLDVGCGIGRMAAPLTKYLSTEGRYEGFDIVQEGTDWSKKNITVRFPNFQFQFADIWNKIYNPRGKFQASSYKFPYPDNTFDFCFLTSVFTHMLSSDVHQYLKEISRTLKPGGKIFATYFLLNEESSTLASQSKSTLRFPYGREGCYLENEVAPETAVAYTEKSVREQFISLGLTITEPIHFGNWCGRPAFLSYQDIVVAEKK